MVFATFKGIEDEAFPVKNLALKIFIFILFKIHHFCQNFKKSCFILFIDVWIRWICNVKAKDEVSSDSLLTKLGIQDLDVVLRTRRMRWFGHVERSTGWISEVRKLNVVAQKRSGRPRKSWDEVIKNDRKKLDMDSADPQNHSEWRGRLRGRLVKKPNPR